VEAVRCVASLYAFTTDAFSYVLHCMLSVDGDADAAVETKS